MTWLGTLGVFTGIAVLVAAVMEPLKLKCFKDNAKQGQMRILAGTLSLGCTVLGYVAFGVQGNLYAIPLYALGVYVVQKQLDMKLIRPKIKELALKKLDKI